MPSAARRERQRIAKQRLERATHTTSAAPAATSAAAAAETTTKDRPSSAADKSTGRQNKATQTPVNVYLLQEMVEIYWRILDRRGLDQAQEPLQIIISQNSSGGAQWRAGSEYIAYDAGYDDGDDDIYARHIQENDNITEEGEEDEEDEEEAEADFRGTTTTVTSTMDLHALD